MKKAFLVAIFILTGCATAQGGLSQLELDIAKQPLICKDKAQCDIYWQRIQSHIVRNSFWKIQISNETLIQTFGPSEDPYISYTVTKNLRQDGSAEIDVITRCGNMFGCRVAPWEGVKQVKEAARGG